MGIEENVDGVTMEWNQVAWWVQQKEAPTAQLHGGGANARHLCFTVGQLLHVQTAWS